MWHLWEVLQVRNILCEIFFTPGVLPKDATGGVVQQEKTNATQGRSRARMPYIGLTKDSYITGCVGFTRPDKVQEVNLHTCTGVHISRQSGYIAANML